MTNESTKSPAEVLGAAADRFAAPIWRTRNGRLRQERSPLGRKQVLLLVRWADRDRGPNVQKGPVGFEPSRGGKPWPDMRPLIDRDLMWASVSQPSTWRDGKWHLGWKRWEAGLTPLGERVLQGILGGMTLRQFELARQALGLSDDCSNAHMNELEDRYPTQATRDERRREHMAMVAAGFAVRHDIPASKWFNQREAFSLTEAGARLALLPGETLSASLFQASIRGGEA